MAGNANFRYIGCDFAVEEKIWAWFRKCLQSICPMPNTIRSCLKNSQNSDLRKIYEKTHTNTNLQYDQFNSTREVIKNIRAGKEQRIGNELTTQELVVKSIWKHSNKASSVLWSKVFTQLPKNIYNFCIRYANNTLANNTNLHKWGKAPSPLCSACNKPQTLGHVVAGCSVHLNEKRYNYRHDSVLLNIVKSIKNSEVRRIYADLEGYISPSIISGEDKRPDIIIVERDNVYTYLQNKRMRRCGVAPPPIIFERLKLL